MEGGRPQPGDRVEQEVEADLELVPEGVPRHRRPSLGEGGEVGVGRAYLRAEDLSAQGGEVLAALERQAQLLEDEAVEVRVEQGERVPVCGRPKPPRRRHPRTASWWREALGASACAGSPSARRPTGGAAAPRRPTATAGPQLGPPLAADDGRWISPNTDVDHGVEQPLLVGDVVVQRHRLDAQASGEGAHRQGGGARSSASAIASATTRARLNGGGRTASGLLEGCSVGACRILRRKGTVGSYHWTSS